jgi:hypothetical protein
MLHAVPHVLDQLDEQDCRRLLKVAPHGRLAFTEGALPMVLPVTYTVCGKDIIASLVGVEVDRFRGAVVAFEVDSYDPQTQNGWCVSVIGPARPITDAYLVAELDALGFAPYTPDVDPGRQYVAIEIAVLRGRRLRARSPQPEVVAGAAVPVDGHT